MPWRCLRGGRLALGDCRASAPGRWGAPGPVRNRRHLEPARVYSPKGRHEELPGDIRRAAVCLSALVLHLDLAALGDG